MQSTEQASKNLIDQAIEGGATAAKIINASDVFVAQWVRHKCQFGCWNFGMQFTCPPYAPTPEETAGTLRHYKQALLVEFRNIFFGDPKVRPDHNLIHRLLYNLERQAFIDGFYRAIAYTAGPCRLCPECPAAKLQNPNLFSKKDCVNQKMARPSMEAASMDVYKTVRQAGFEIHVVRDKKDAYTSFGLVLLE
ncbi:MAG: DUF2284 domain-containing protein [Desulfobacterales bacterium]|nr:DUF2284 domain-containing protein [Desulfobacterales bacterium]